MQTSAPSPFYCPFDCRYYARSYTPAYGSQDFLHSKMLRLRPRIPASSVADPSPPLSLFLGGAVGFRVTLTVVQWAEQPHSSASSLGGAAGEALVPGLRLGRPGLLGNGTGHRGLPSPCGRESQHAPWLIVTSWDARKCHSGQPSPIWALT